MLLSTLRHLLNPPLQLDHETLETGRILYPAQITGILYLAGILMLVLGVASSLDWISLPALHKWILLGLGLFQVLSAWLSSRFSFWSAPIWSLNLVAYQLALLGIVYANPAQQQILFSEIFPILAGFLTLSRRNGLIQTGIGLAIPVLLQALGQPLQDKTFWLNYFIFILVGAAVSLMLHNIIHRYIRQVHKLLGRLNQLAMQDPLTGALNRRGFFHEGEAIFALHRRAILPLTLALIDLDYFKQVNDTYGHEAGDAVLKEIVARLRHHFRRKSDLVGRLGGDELVIMLPNTPVEQACELLTQFATYLQRNPIRFQGVEMPIALSIGSAAMNPEHHHELKALLNDADTAVYRAKEAGRSHVCCTQKSDCIPVKTFFEPPTTTR